MSNRVDGWESSVTASKKLGYCIDGWMNEWISWIKLNYNVGQIYKKISNFDYLKNWKFFSYIKVGIENGEKVRRTIEIKFRVEKTLDDGWVDG